MANEPLRSALLRAGLEPEELAARAQVDAKTVGRWLGGRQPHARYRARVAQLLNVQEADLWPETAPTSPLRDDRRELTGIYAQANDIRVPDWRALLQQARDQIDLLEHTLTGILPAPGAIETLAAKADAGCQIRILIAHPESIYLAGLAEELGQREPDNHGNLPLELQIDQARALLQPLLGHPHIQIASHWAERFNTILRFDDEMLVVLHLYAARAPHAPLLHLQRRSDEGVFEQFAAHVEAIHHQASEPLAPNPDLYPPPDEQPQRYRPRTDPAAWSEVAIAPHEP